jgi:hypothetical protein
VVPINLAGALGVLLWMLVPVSATTTGNSSGTGPTGYGRERVWRQPTSRGDWAGVFPEVAASLEQIVDKRGRLSA